MNEKDYELIMKAKSYLNNKEEQENGIEILDGMAKKKNKYAIYELGKLYKDGIYFEKNINIAENYFLLSSELKYEKATYELGLIYLEKRRYEKAKKYFESCVHLSNAIYELGLLYYMGLGCSISRHKAFSYFMEASNKGSKEADYMIANAYLHGDGIKLNKEKGLYYLRKAYLKNVPDRMRLYFYLNNLEAKKNDRRISIQ